MHNLSTLWVPFGGRSSPSFETNARRTSELFAVSCGSPRVKFLSQEIRAARLQIKTPPPKKILELGNSERPRFGSVRLRFGAGTVQAVPVFGSAGSSAKKVFFVSVQFNRKGRFRFRFRFLENGSGGSGSAFGFGKNGSDGSRFPVPVRFLSHPGNSNFVPVPAGGHFFQKFSARLVHMAFLEK